MASKLPWAAGIFATLALLLVIGCGSGQSAPATGGPASAEAPSNTIPSENSPSRERTIVLGDIDDRDPAKKIKRFMPLAGYLAGSLKEYGIERGDVVIARDIDEMARFLNDGVVDIYFDSAYPALRVQELSGSEVISRRWKRGVASYWGIFVTAAGSGITSPEDFVGRVIAFEDKSFTSGFLLQAGSLLQKGLSIKLVSRPDSPVGPDEIGYIFTGDEENTMELVLQKKVAGGGVSNLDYEELPAELKDQIAVIGRTIEIPRQLVSVRPGLGPELTSKALELLIGLDETASGLELLANLKRTTRFDEVPEDSKGALDQVKGFISLVEK